jgi:hypothetical protein
MVDVTRTFLVRVIWGERFLKWGRANMTIMSETNRISCVIARDTQIIMNQPNLPNTWTRHPASSL